MPTSIKTEVIQEPTTEVPTDEEPEKTFSGISALSKAAQKLKGNRGKIPKSCRVTNMDEAKALGIFGFTSKRWLDMSSGLTPKEELDKAHFAKTMAITKKKDSDDKANNSTEQLYSFRRKQMSADDQIRLLHEAYQFLLKKYKVGEDPKVITSLITPFMKLQMDEKPIVVIQEEAAEESEKEETEEAEIEEPNRDYDDYVLELEKAMEKALQENTTERAEKKGSIKRKKSTSVRASKVKIQERI